MAIVFIQCCASLYKIFVHTQQKLLTLEAKFLEHKIVFLRHLITMYIVSYKLVW